MRKTVQLLSILVLAVFSRAEAQVDDIDRPIQAIHIIGNRSISEKDLLNVLPIKIGNIYSDKLGKAVSEVEASVYRSQGFLDCTVEPKAEVVASSVTLTLVISEGPLFHFGRTTIEGLTTLPDKVVLNLLSYHPGDVFKKRELFTTQTELYRSGYFSSINIQTATTTMQTADVIIALAQQPTRWLKAGVGWGSEERERISLTLTHDNLFRRAYQAELYGTVSSIWQEYRADFTNPYFFNTRTRERTSLGWRREDRQGYAFERMLGEASFSRSLSRTVSASWTPYQIKRTNTFDVDPEISAITPDLTDERTMLVALNEDSADDFFFPKRGTRNNLVFQRTGGVFGGNIDFHKASLESRAYTRPIKPIVLAVSARIGGIWPYWFSRVPIYDRFFVGGGNSIRGYAERGVGPKDISGSPLGGNWLANGMVELRFPVVWKIEGAAFIDGGQVAARFREVQTKNWRYGAGGGLRLRTPVGPIRLDYGHKINPASEDKDHWRLHFSLGETF